MDLKSAIAFEGLFLVGLTRRYLETREKNRVSIESSVEKLAYPTQKKRAEVVSKRSLRVRCNNCSMTKAFLFLTAAKNGCLRTTPAVEI